MPPAIDREALRWVLDHRTTALTELFRTVTAFGSFVAILAAVAIVAALLVGRRRADLATVLLVSSAGTWLTVNGLKLLVRRPRPPEVLRLAHASGWSFPSGHAGNAAATYLAIGVVAALVLPRRWERVAAVACGAVVTMLIGISRVYLGVHWLTDVLAGWFVGVAWLATLLVVTTGRRVDRAGVHRPLTVGEPSSGSAPA